MRALGIGAFIATIISAMFHWHVMQNGAMLVGHDNRSFGENIKQMPRLVASFVWKPVRLVIRGCAVKCFPPRSSLKLQR